MNPTHCSLPKAPTATVGCENTSTIDPAAEPRADAHDGDDAGPRRPQPERREKPNPRRTWLAGDPFQWVGKKIRSLKSGATYTIRNVFRNGRVELEKSWMTYSSNIDAIRSGYEPCI